MTTNPPTETVEKMELPEYARKIAAAMYPQTVKEDYSHWEVERLLIAVCAKASELAASSAQEAKAGLIQEIEGMKKDKPQPPTPSQYVKTCLNIMERERVSAYNQAIDDVLAILKGDKT